MTQYISISNVQVPIIWASNGECIGHGLGALTRKQEYRHEL